MGTKAQILIIEDDVDTSEAMKLTLESQDYTVFTADNPKDGIEKARAEKPDLIILDVMMPEVTGLEVCRKLKRNHRTADIPVIMFSALGTGTHLMLEKEDQADGYLQKPFTMSTLSEKVDQVLRAKQRINLD